MKTKNSYLWSLLWMLTFGRPRRFRLDYKVEPLVLMGYPDRQGAPNYWDKLPDLLAGFEGAKYQFLVVDNLRKSRSDTPTVKNRQGLITIKVWLRTVEALSRLPDWAQRARLQTLNVSNRQASWQISEMLLFYFSLVSLSEKSKVKTNVVYLAEGLLWESALLQASLKTGLIRTFAFPHTVINDCQASLNGFFQQGLMPDVWLASGPAVHFQLLRRGVEEAKIRSVEPLRFPWVENATQKIPKEVKAIKVFTWNDPGRALEQLTDVMRLCQKQDYKLKAIQPHPDIPKQVVERFVDLVQMKDSLSPGVIGLIDSGTSAWLETLQRDRAVILWTPDGSLCLPLELSEMKDNGVSFRVLDENFVRLELDDSCNLGKVLFHENNDLERWRLLLGDLTEKR